MSKRVVDSPEIEEKDLLIHIQKEKDFCLNIFLTMIVHQME